MSEIFDPTLNSRSCFKY